MIGLLEAKEASLMEAPFLFSLPSGIHATTTTALDYSSIHSLLSVSHKTTCDILKNCQPNKHGYVVAFWEL